MGGRALEPSGRTLLALRDARGHRRCRVGPGSCPGGTDRDTLQLRTARHRKGDPTLPSMSLMSLVPLLMGFMEPLPCSRVSPEGCLVPPQTWGWRNEPQKRVGSPLRIPHGSPHRELGSAGRVGAGCAAGTPQPSARCHCHGNSASHGAERRQGGRKEAGRRLVPARGGHRAAKPPASPRHRGRGKRGGRLRADLSRSP